MSFGGDLGNFGKKTTTLVDRVFTGVVFEAKNSITFGSPITGAPGQPVDTGALRASWHDEIIARGVATISTNLVYAPLIEDGEGKMTLHSEVGGFGSVKLTVANGDRIVQHVTAEVTGGI